jgi:hypothetical protein
LVVSTMVFSWRWTWDYSSHSHWLTRYVGNGIVFEWSPHILAKVIWGKKRWRQVKQRIQIQYSTQLWPRRPKDELSAQNVGFRVQIKQRCSPIF